ncbi:hypothetical protein H5410_025848 [Solanum commersonii]|uniref:Uncharacterized protein n=1 Tax=Solanum commersonii TaxID=4109 RepID=A0A9J5YZ35_SOLCO|nr:hypothetical protein H5410_025848 [Solanum commersonii]
MEVEMGAHATNSLLKLRIFAEKLGESITLSLETDTTGAKEVTFQSNLEPLLYQAHKFGINESESQLCKSSSMLVAYSIGVQVTNGA